MTNSEKYKEVFGLEHPDCPTWNCPTCPVFEDCCNPKHYTTVVLKWWDSEYEGRV